MTRPREGSLDSFVSWSPALQQTTSLSAHELESFARSLVSGIAQLEKKEDPRFSRSVLGNEGYLCAFCTACQWDGAAKRLLSATELVPHDLAELVSALRDRLAAGQKVAVAEDVRCALLLELISFRGRALARLGIRDLSQQEWGMLEGPGIQALLQEEGLPWTQRGLRVAKAKVAVERGVMALNQGRFGQALEFIEPALADEGVQDVAVELRGLGVCQLACIFVGAESKRKVFFSRESALLEGSAAGIDAFQKSRARREITALLYQEAFEDAQLALEQALKKMEGQDDLLEALLRQQRLKLHLIRNDCEAAQEELHSLEQFAKVRSFPTATFDLSPQRYELAFRQKKHEKLGEELKLGLAKALERDDVHARMSASVFLARWQLLAGQSQAARESILAALEICEAENYGSDRVDCLFHAMGVAHATRDLKLFRDCTLKAGKLCRKLGLSVKAACFEYILSLTSPARERSSLPLLELLRAPKVGKEAYYFLDYYGFLKGTLFEVKNANSRETMTLVDERDLRESVMAGAGVWWFADAGVLLAVKNPDTSSVSVVSVELAKGSLVQQVFEALLEAGSGISTQEVHSLSSSAPYHPLRHGSKVKTLLHRLRTLLEPTGLGLPSARHEGRYVLEGKAHLFLVHGPVL